MRRSCGFLVLTAAWLLCGPPCPAQDLRADLLRLHEDMGITAAQDELRRQGQEPGQGLRVAVIDDGFCLRHAGLAHLRDSGVVDSWDWLKGSRDAWDTTARKAHGSSVLGVLASRWDSLPGVLPAARWLLYRTEVDSFERPSEEEWLALALTRAVDSGAQVISVSLGYRYQFDSVPDLSWSLMDGWQRPESRAARRAAARGALVVVAMGNDGPPGSDGFPTLGAPADADSVLAVGAVDEDGDRCYFSSVGNAYDGRVKPDLTAFGCPVPVLETESPAGSSYSGGTSFATPLMAGAAGLLRQLHPGWSVQEVIAALKASADRAASPDSLRGWGRPDLRKLLTGFVTSGRDAPEAWARAGLRGIRALRTLPAGTLACRDLRGRLLWTRDLEATASGRTVADLPLPSGLSVLSWRAGTARQELKLLVP